MWAKTGAKPTALVLNSADYPSLSDKAAAGPGDTVGVEVARFNGIPLVVKAIGGDDPADTYLPPPVVPYATTMLEAPDGLRIGYVESVEAIGVTIAADCVEAVIKAARGARPPPGADVEPYSWTLTSVGASLTDATTPQARPGSAPTPPRCPRWVNDSDLFLTAAAGEPPALLEELLPPPAYADPPAQPRHIPDRTPKDSNRLPPFGS